MDKKAQGMSINVIIIAALGILVLVVISFLFLGQGQKINKETNSCSNNGGTCISTPAGGLVEDVCKKVLDYVCTDDTQVCCLAVGAVV